MEGTEREASKTGTSQYGEPEPTRPVTLEAHQDVVRYVEQQVRDELQKQTHRWTPIGTRITYTMLGSDNQPSGEEYRFECGYLEPLDEARTVYPGDPEWDSLNSNQDDPLGDAFLDALYERVKADLQQAAGHALLVNVSGVLSGSLTCYGRGCWCYPNKGKYSGCTIVCLLSAC